MAANRLLVASATVLCAAALAACSSDSSGSSNTPASSTGPSATTSVSAAPTTGSSATSGGATSGSSAGTGSATAPANASGPAGTSAPVTGPTISLTPYVLRASDLPPGWKATKADTSNDNSKSPEFTACTGIKDTSGDKLRSVASPNFENGTLSISSTSELYRSTADVANDRTLFTNPKAKQCFADELTRGAKKNLPAGTTISNISITLTPGRGNAPSTVVATLAASFQVSQGGQRATFYSDSAFIAKGAVEVEVDFSGFGMRVDAATRASVTNSYASRIAKL